jgi:NADP-dependent 3-hydroxy acid dehydrogenase YdfG
VRVKDGWGACEGWVRVRVNGTDATGTEATGTGAHVTAPVDHQSHDHQSHALQADGSVRVEPKMSAEDAADAVLYMASLPLSANVLSMTVMATNMPFVGRG